MRLAFAVAVLAMCACSKPEGQPPVGAPQELLSQISVLQAQVRTLEQQVVALESSVKRLSSRQPETATFSPSNKHYSVVVTPEGATFLVTLDNVQPYADGQRLTFRIGNPQTATYKNPSVALKWGRRFESTTIAQPLPADEVRELRELGVVGALLPDGGVDDWEDELTDADIAAAQAAFEADEKARAAWEAALHSKTEQVLVDLRPGTWTKVVIAVAPASSEEVGHVEFAMTTAAVSMAGR